MVFGSRCFTSERRHWPMHGTAGVGEYRGADVLQRLHLTVALDSRPDLFRAWGDQQPYCGLCPVCLGLVRNVGGAAHVLVGRVGAAADKGHGNIVHVALCLYLFGQMGDRTGKVRCMGADHVRLQRGEVNVDDSVVESVRVCLNFRVCFQQMPVLTRLLNQSAPSRRLQVEGHVVVEGEDGPRCAELRAHVCDGGLTGAADGPRAGAEVFNDAVGAAGDGQHAGQVENNVLRRRPALELAGEANADAPRVHDLPRKAGHDVRAVRAANADGEHPQAAGVRGVGVGADHQAAREGVVLQHHLVDDSRAGFPESHAVLGGGRLEELVDLAVLQQVRRRYRTGSPPAPESGGRSGRWWGRPRGCGPTA